MTKPLSFRRCLTHTLLGACLLAGSVAQASFLENDAALRFADEMVNEHQFSRAEVFNVLGKAEYLPRVIRLITPPEKKNKAAVSWQKYRQRFLQPDRVNAGVHFWQRHQAAIDAAEQRYGVPAEIIVAIIGIETNYGSYTGGFNTASALATLAFYYPERAPLFRKELTNLLLLAREQGVDPSSYTGSYAGAIGYGQFLPSSIRQYGIDFDGDGHINLQGSVSDAIASVANYLAAHGWVAGQTIAVPLAISPSSQLKPLVDQGIEPRVTRAELIQQQISAKYAHAPLLEKPATIVDLQTPAQATEYWAGYRNFYVLTRYNRSSFYAMSVMQLADAIRQAH